MNDFWPFVLLGVVVVVLGVLIVKQLRTDRQMGPTKQRILADPVVRTFPGVRVQLNPGTQKSGFLKGGSDLNVRSRSFDFGLTSRFGAAYRYYLDGEDTEMRAARLRFGNTRNRDCILITGPWAGKQMDAAIAADGQLAEMWMLLASVGVKPMTDAPREPV